MSMHTWWLASALAITLNLVCLGATPIGESPVPPGEHPRLLFHGRQIWDLRRRAATPEGQSVVAQLRQQAFGGRDIEVHKLAARDPDWIATAKTETSILGRFTKQCWHAALLWLATGDERDGLVAAEMFRLWLSSYPPTEEIVPAESWGNPWAAMTYDWLYPLLTKDEQDHARAILASMVGQPTLDAVGQRWWNGGPTPSGRNTTNWTAIYSSSLGITLLAIEGEKGYNPDLLPIAIDLQREFLNGGVSPDGALYEGLGYASGYGTKDVPFFLQALEQRGVSYWKQTNLPKVTTWLSYELLPWGYEGFPLNQSDGALGCGELLTFLTQEQSGISRWIYHNTIPRKSGTLTINPGIGLVNGWPRYKGERPDALPLGHWFSNRGLVFSRSGWGERDAAFVFNSNPLGAGHTHADQGHFCLAANGAAFFTEGGVTKFESRYHNIVLIDGKGQACSQSRVDAFLRSADITGYADVSDIDQKLAYDRVLQGDTSFEWVEVNPVQKAERQALFVRGASGPFVVIADELRKDNDTHTYTWLGHVPENNPLRVDGRTFHIEERFGGKFFQAIEAGHMTAMERNGIKNGTLRGWLLVRSIPHIRSWSSNNLSVNGHKAPYNTSYFGLDLHYQGWRWNSILPENKAEIPIEDGKLRFEFATGSGGQVALAVFTYDPKWEPGDEIPADGGDFIVLSMDDVVPTENPWPIVEVPNGVLDGAFLGQQPPSLSIKAESAVRTRVINATQENVTQRFLAVMAPHDEGDDRTLTIPDWGAGQAAELKSAGGTDLIAGVVDGELAGRLITDGAAATASLGPDGKTLLGFALVQGTKLSLDGRALVTADAPVQAIYDGQQLVIRGPGGTSVTIAREQAKRLQLNGKALGLPGGDPLSIAIPDLPTTWTTAISDDGTHVTVTGNGPEPLWIEAPKATQVSVNGIDRYFIRSQDHQRICPPLAAGSPFPYAGEIAGADLAKILPGGAQGRLGDARELDPSGPATQVLIADDGLATDVPIPGPSAYQLVLLYLADAPLTIAINEPTGVRKETATPTGKGVQRLTIKDVMLNHTPARLTFTGAGRFAIQAIRLQPQYRDLSANLWSTIGPFPSTYTRKNATNEAVKQALDTIFPPEKAIDLQAAYSGVDDAELHWLQSDSTDGPSMLTGVNFKLRNGVKMSQISYAVTFIDCPDERTAEISLNCDYWANVYVNGKLLHSDRDAGAVAEDSAWFKGLKRQKGLFTLKKGRNTLLVKTHGGMGGSSFNAAITDPGDLTISADASK